MSSPSRRLLLAQGAALAGAALLPGAWRPALAQARLADDPFRLGVASGEPAPDGVVLWTRLAPRPLDPDGGMPAAPVDVGWQVAEDEAMARVIASGRTPAVPEAGHSVHVEVQGLRPNREYWYRFTAGGHASPVARTRTTPAPGWEAGHLRVAYGSCQKFEAGYWGAYDHLVEDRPDLVLFLGDYIYEQAATDKGVRRHPGPEPTEIGGYRVRYGAYKSDPKLQAAHAVAPWMVTWDDHEVENDYGGDQSEDDLDPAAFLRRRAAAYQAYYEHMPLRRRSRPVGPQMLLYRTLDWGRLAQFQFLDTRQYRPHRTCQAQADGKSIPDCPERTDPARSILGERQERWLMETLSGSHARWNILAQQYAMGELKRPSPAGTRWSNDGWDGSPMTRRRIAERWRDARVGNPLVVGGDIHCFMAGDIGVEPNGPPVASEFVGGSISSLGRDNPTLAALAGFNPHLKFTDGETRGYGLIDIGPAAATVTFRGVESALVPSSPRKDLAKFAVETGRACSVLSALAILLLAASADPQATELHRYKAPEANQGVAVDAGHFYAVGNSEIGKYDKATGRRVGGWKGDPRTFPHLNSCTVVGPELVCASSNYPATPMASTVEVFDPVAMTHLRSIPLGRQPGSLTWADRRDGAWWAGFANYDGRGGEPGRDHRFTTLVKFDDGWRPLAAWTFPETVLARFRPRSSSGGGFGDDGLLYVTGHDEKEVYVLRVPASGAVLEHVATIAVPVEGQAIAFDRSRKGVLFGVSRPGREVVAMQLPPMGER